MEIDPAEKSRVWWSGALKSAAKGIPQGILLGLLGAGVIWGALTVLPMIPVVSGIAAPIIQAFTGFIFAPGATVGFLPLAPWPFVMMNTVLTAVGNFLVGGDLAVAKHQQEVDHAHNDARIRAIESREHMVEQAVGEHLVQPPQRSMVVDSIIRTGPRPQQSYAAAEDAREAQAPQGPTIH